MSRRSNQPPHLFSPRWWYLLYLVVWLQVMERSPEDAETTRVERDGVGLALPPRQVWCPRCGRTIIDPVVERVCVECDRS